MPLCMSLETLWQYCHTWITYRSASRVTLVTTDHITHGTISHVQLGHAQQMMNVQATETHDECMHSSNPHMTHSYD